MACRGLALAAAWCLTSASAPAQAQSKQLSYNGFSCDVYGSQAPKVMDNDAYNLAYDFNVTELGSGSYVAVFHAEPYRKAVGCWGDSVAVRYAGSPDGYFGSRTGDCNDCPGDHVITRTSAYSHMMYSADCTGLGGLSGGGNPMLVRRQGSPEWTLFFLSVSDYDEATASHDGFWRHYLMVAHPTDINNLLGCDWAALANNGTADYWHWFSGTPPKWQSYQPWPARLSSNGALLQGASESFQSADTQGLIGNITYDGSLSTIYYFYIDIVSGQSVTRRQQMGDLTSVNWWGDPVTIRNDWVNVAFHAGRGLWAVLSNCYDTSAPGWDVCLRFTPSASVGDIDGLPAADPVAHGLGLAAFFHDPVTGGVMEQYGFLKNPYGQIPGDDFRIYVAERSAGGLYGMDMYSVRVDCHCAAPLCGGVCCQTGQVCSNDACCTPDCTGQECGGDGCGSSCGSCAGGEICNAVGECVPETCVPECGAQQCGPDPTCGLSCGDCAPATHCNLLGQCVPDDCVPACDGRECGADPICAESCGDCAPAEHCSTLGSCVPDGCVPACDGRECGPDPICAEACGGCHDGAVCSAEGRCVGAADSTVRGGCSCQAGPAAGPQFWLLILIGGLAWRVRSRGRGEPALTTARS